MRVLAYDWDDQLRCYMGPVKVDPTPLTLDLAIACRLTGRPLYRHHVDRAGRRHLACLWARPIPNGVVLLPEHRCGARIPTTLPPLTDPEPAPALCPF
ncbi:hypothetical protein [Microbacterium sp. PA5]|uniref:hypothetical protein n=1 Tax=Microbacterium sp. PA5 TaxID=3416654 RepID=UPI003CF15678